MFNRLLFFVYLLYCFEVGLFLMIFPWLELWDQNSLLNYLSSPLREAVLSNYFRGAVSGLGLANVTLGLWEVLRVFVLPQRSAKSGDSLRHLES
ncbi:MAG TPA: hypothetical protein VLU25_08950 [Acidobacteriota bacterium]|nr:hypothetical protein [Acidobacteriota bacterium]